MGGEPLVASSVYYADMKRLFISLLIPAMLSACTDPFAEPPIALLGDSISPTAAERTIEIFPETKWVNVVGGENIKFVVGDQSFGWAFNVASSVSSFDLQRVAPPGILDRPVIAYVETDPKYKG